MGLASVILNGLTGPVADFFKRRAELKEARYEAKLRFEQAVGDRLAKLASEGLAADANWEMEFARQAASSWKDEYTLLVVSIPMVLCFIDLPWLNGPGIVNSGFAALATTPTFYQILLSSIFGATYGIRMWRRTQSDT